jgi:exonuclease SbcC
VAAIVAVLSDARQALASETGRLEAVAEGLGRRIAERAGLERERRERLAGAARHAALAHELRRDRFVEYLLDHSLGLLAEQASERLRDISGGRYSLRVHGNEFHVADHFNADEERSVRTLSGGETFQASLALALALSGGIGDLETGGAGMLDAVFIDEGFGSLDVESLDVAIDALEQLQAATTMVGVITHLPQMADRLPQGVEVVKESAGSRIVRR